MNKLLIVLMAICLVSVHGFVKRDAPEAAAAESPDLAEKIKKGAEDLLKQFDTEKITKGFNDLVDKLNTAATNFKLPSADETPK